MSYNTAVAKDCRFNRCTNFITKRDYVTFGICYRKSVCLSVTFVHPTQPGEILRNVSMPFCTLAIC